MAELKKILYFFLMCCMTVLLAGSTKKNALAAETEEIELYARSAVLMDGDSGRILYGKNEETPMPMASTTKIMTCILALEHARPDTVCRVSGTAAAQPQVKLGMVKEDTFYLEDLLYSLMLESHNDTAVCIAEAVAGSVEDFAALMNQKAETLGCTDTYYITPNGLDADDANGTHHTTASELALIMKYCLKESPEKETFLEITQTSSYTFTNIEGTRSYGCTNHNTLFSILDGVVSGKTGYTGAAGYCYVGAVRQKGKLLIVALLACGWPGNRAYKWVDTKRLIRYGTENFELRQIIDPDTETWAIQVEGGIPCQVGTRVCWEDGQGIAGEKEENAGLPEVTVLMRPEEEVIIKKSLVESLRAPAKEGSVVGTVSFCIGETEYAVFPVVTEEASEEKNYAYYLKILGGDFVNFMTKKLAFFL